MTRNFIALDVETTGLDPDSDRITEVAAVRFNEHGEELATFQTLVNPGRQLPAFVQALTGLRPEDLEGAPDMKTVGPQIADFAGYDPLVGHNVAFDLTFLERGGCRLPGAPIDTVALSRVLLPAAESHRLSAIAELLEIDPGESHRALDDAQTAAKVLVALLQKAESLTDSTRIQLARLAAGESVTLAELVAGSGWESIAQKAIIPEPGKWTAPPALARLSEPEPADPQAAARVLAAGNNVLEAFEERPQQSEMAESVSAAFANGGHWLIEAGTGVGKSLAYLIPAALHALRTGERVVVSTNTISLQEQLLSKDLPILKSLLVSAGAVAKEEDLRVAVLKGRGNYICYRRWLGGFASGSNDPDFERLAARVLLWLQTTETGDRSELNLDRSMRAVWSRFSAEGADCLSRQNKQVRAGQCFLARARRGAESAHIVIVNHALLLADLASGRSAIPPFDHVIVDEAHNLEDQATRQFGRRASRRILDDLLAPFWRAPGSGERAGGIGALLRALPEGPARTAADTLVEAVGAVRPPALQVFAAMAEIRQTHNKTELLLTRGIRNGEEWADVEVRHQALGDALEAVLSAAAAAAEAVIDGSAEEVGEKDDLLAGEIDSATVRLETFRNDLASMVAQQDPNEIVWVAEDREGTGTLTSAPLEVGPILAEQLFSDQQTVIATSATLSAAGSMKFAADRLGLPEADSAEIGSPFDYEKSALLADVTDVPDPGGNGYQERIADALELMIGASEGRALVLFTSHAALRDAAARTRESLRARDITVLAQDVDGSPAELVNILRSRPRTAIFGTASFWEGVDVRGDALSLLVIVRLPFGVPTDPIHQARSGLKDDPFREYSLPGAILRFRQGFGRLIRDGRDRGAIVVLDRRITSRSYGPDFIRALPKCTRVRGPSETVATEVREWLDSSD